MKIKTKNFGEVQINEAIIIHFEEGVPGFRELKEYIIIEDEENTFSYLQSVQDGNICFVIINPYLLKEDYIVDIKDQYIESLGGGTQEDYSIYNIATVVSDLEHWDGQAKL